MWGLVFGSSEMGINVWWCDNGSACYSSLGRGVANQTGQWLAVLVSLVFDWVPLPKRITWEEQEMAIPDNLRPSYVHRVVYMHPHTCTPIYTCENNPMHRVWELLVEKISFFMVKEWILSFKVRNMTCMPALGTSIQHCTEDINDLGCVPPPNLLEGR